MNQPTRLRSLARRSATLLALLLSAGTALAATVSMPTPQGNRPFDSGAFAFATLAGPSGEFACFTAGMLSACNPAMLQVAALGPDLSTGLTLGTGSEVTLAFRAAGPDLAIWEAGDSSLAHDVSEALVSVHTAAGWTAFQSFGSSLLAPVLDDTRPSGYQTNFGSLSGADFGLGPVAQFDAVRIESCCDADSHFDLLAVAGTSPGVPVVPSVPEPSTSALMLSGLLVVAMLARRRKIVDAGRNEA